MEKVPKIFLIVGISIIFIYLIFFVLIPEIQLMPLKSQLKSSCIETDGGNNIYVKGVLKTETHGSTGNYYDLCWSGGDVLHEWYCEEGSLQKLEYRCPNGCKDGACVKD